MDHKQWIRDVVDSDEGRAAGKTRAGLARALKRAQSAVNRLLDEDQQLKVSDIPAIVAFLEVEPPPFYRSRFVPLLGKVAGGHSEAVLYGENGGPLDWIALPRLFSPGRAALEVEGESMLGVAGPGYIVFIAEKHQPPTTQQHGELCVCMLANEQRVVKFLKPSKYDGKYDLHSSSADPLLAQAVLWAAVVTDIVPRSQARGLARRSEADDSSEFLNFENLT